jgi:glycosyltransferase involved in cell wall biosynthesis
MSKNRFVLITPARNEEKYIEQTILSVAKQTVLPIKWVIVNDCSTDSTGEIVEKNAKRLPFLQLVNLTGREKRDFASKVYAVKEGYALLKGLEYDFLGNLDADTILPENYYETIMIKMNENPKLGIAGGLVMDLVGDKFIAQRPSLNSVAGPIQLFNRNCWEEIGGYIPLQYGGVDSSVEVISRMKGWQVQTFPEHRVRQLRRVGTAQRSFLLASFIRGRMFCSLGYHPLFQFVRCLARLKDYPFFLCSGLEFAGYLWSKMCGVKVQLAPEVVRYLHREQLARLKEMVTLKKR